MDNSKQIIALYDDYNTIIKPLIAEVEARTEQFPLPLFNEIYAYSPHSTAKTVAIATKVAVRFGNFNINLKSATNRV